MPIYEYTCQSCKNHFEKLVKSASDADRIACPQCGSAKTARNLSVFAVSASESKSESPAPGICGRCGGPGPCGMN